MDILRRFDPKRTLGRWSWALIAVGAMLAGIARGEEIYRLTSASSFQEGCFDPCLCPLTQEQPVVGTFSLRAIASQGGFDRYAVVGVHWRVQGRDPELRVSGSGIYSVGSPDATTVRKHRLELDLRLNGSTDEHFDSGWVVGPGLPHIQIPISVHGMSCYDRVFVVDADPVPRSQIRPYALVEGSTFQRGCFDPCDCLLGQEVPLVGTFSLLPLTDDGLFAEFAVVDARWEVQGSSYSTPSDAAITGQGSYSIGGEFAQQQRLEAKLQIADEPQASFDSGRVVGGGGFPGEIDVEISRNGKVCFDTVMRVRAKGQTIPEPGATMQLVAGLIGLLAFLSFRSRRLRSV